MTVKNILTHIIKEYLYIPAPITEKSNFYTDLGLDSLSFITILTKIEETFMITFDVTEMEACLQVDQLITTIEKKIKEHDVKNDQTFIVKSKKSV